MFDICLTFVVPIIVVAANFLFDGFHFFPFFVGWLQISPACSCFEIRIERVKGVVSQLPGTKERKEANNHDGPQWGNSCLGNEKEM